MHVCLSYESNNISLINHIHYYTHTKHTYIYKDEKRYINCSILDLVYYTPPLRSSTRLGKYLFEILHFNMKL